MLIILIIIGVLIGGFSWYKSNIQALNSSKDGIRVEIQQGIGVSGIADLLEENEWITIY